MPRIANNSDIKALSELWKKSFGDSDEYIDFFMKNAFNYSICVAKEENSKIVSALYLLDCSIGETKGKYLYAASTLNEYRHTGIMKELLDYSKALLVDNYDFICLVPANDKLFSYYSKNGFKDFFYNKTVAINNMQQVINIENISYEEFSSLRNNSKSSFVKWDKNIEEYIFNENIFNNGKNVKTKTGYVIMREYNDICEVIEWLSDDYDISELTATTKCVKILIRLADDSKSHCNGMIFSKTDLSPCNGMTLSLVLD